MSQNWTPPPSSTATPATVPNYLVMAIISVLCCWPLAIPAIIFATQVNSKVAAGDIAGAQEASRKAKLFSYISIGIGLVIIAFYIVMMILGVGLSALGGGGR